MMTNTETLRRWRSRNWTRPDDKSTEAFDTTRTTGVQPVLVAMDDIIENRDLTALYRTFERNGYAARLFHPKGSLEGTPWYDGLERIVAMGIEYRIGDETFTLECPRADPDPDAARRASHQGCVNAITVRVVLRRKETTTPLALETDFAVADEYEPAPANAGILLAKETSLGIDDLTELIHDAIFEPGDGHEHDAFETQMRDSREDAHYAACRLLLDDATAETEKIRYAVQHRIAHLIPDGHTVRIVKHEGEENVEVIVGSK